MRAEGYSKVPISKFFFIFVGYVLGHMIIGFLQKNYREKLMNNQSDADLQKTVKTLDFLMQWFPAIYLIIMLIGFYI